MVATVESLSMNHSVVSPNLRGSVTHYVQFAVSGCCLMKCVNVSPKLPDCRWVATSVAADSADRYILKVRP
jgi:hypothetical protein